MLIYTKQEAGYPGSVWLTPFTSLQIKILHLMASSHTVILIAVGSAYPSGATSLGAIKMTLLSAGYVFEKLIPCCKHYVN